MKPRLLQLAAPKILGAFFLALGFSSCEEQKQAEWPGPTLEEPAAPSSAAETKAAAEDGSMNAEKASKPGPGDKASGSISFVAYNLENWLTMDRYVDRQQVSDASKPEKEKQAIISLLSRSKPDILGVCEIGSEADLKDLQSRLAEAGLDLPHSYHTGGADPVRRLAMLSRFPIASTQAHNELSYQLEGRTFEMGRGILDATVETPAGPVRFIGTHLKSKREIPEADQEMMRRAEAHLVREQIESILEQSPEMPLVVYGDMNDTRQATTLRTLQGPRNGPTSMKMAFLKDSVGTSWTHFWSYQDVYSRFDYILFNEPMTDRFVWENCHVIDDPEAAIGSDHRPLYVEFR